MGRAQLEPAKREETKKLTEAGEYWASAPPPSPAEDDQGLQDDMEAMGLSMEMRERILESAQPEEHDRDFTILPDNVPALNLFLACRTQWRTSMTGVTGLDYNAVLAVLPLHADPDSNHRELFEEVQLIESGALQALSRKR